MMILRNINPKVDHDLKLMEMVKAIQDLKLEDLYLKQVETDDLRAEADGLKAVLDLKEVLPDLKAVLEVMYPTISLATTTRASTQGSEAELPQAIISTTTTST